MNFNKIITLLCRTASIVAVCGLPVLSQAQETTTDRAMLVLDASGSMWGQIDGEAKITIARTAVADMLVQWNTSTDLGLIAYGHNRAGDCGDIELLLPAQPLDADIFSSVVNGLNPRGKTPLTDAVVMAAEALGYTEKKATVILLTDGLETCDRDPCAIGTLLEERGIDFTAHVIGFDVAESDAGALSCLAENTGGLYLPAGDMQSLTDALQQVSEAAVVPEIVYDLSPATITVPESVVVGRNFMVAWTGPQNPGDRLAIRDENGDGHGGQPLAADDFTSPIEMLAPATVGVYQIFYDVPGYDTPLASTILNVVAVAPSVTIPETVPSGADFTVEWTGPGASGDRIFVVDPASGDQFSMDQARAEDDGIGVLQAPEIIGTFEVQLIAARTGEVRASATFTTTPVSGSITMPDGPYIAGARAMQVEWTGPKNSGDRLRVYPRGSDASIMQRPAFGTASSPTNVRIPREPGLYTIKLISTEGTIYAEQDFEVLPEQ